MLRSQNKIKDKIKRIFLVFSRQETISQFKNLKPFESFMGDTLM
jgi:hypothetical protein